MNLKWIRLIWIHDHLIEVKFNSDEWFTISVRGSVRSIISFQVAVDQRYILCNKSIPFAPLAFFACASYCTFRCCIWQKCWLPMPKSLMLKKKPVLYLKLRFKRTYKVDTVVAVPLMKYFVANTSKLNWNASRFAWIKVVNRAGMDTIDTSWNRVPCLHLGCWYHTARLLDQGLLS